MPLQWQWNGFSGFDEPVLHHNELAKLLIAHICRRRVTLTTPTTNAITGFPLRNGMDLMMST
jgi:hypothetical protein